MFYCLSKPAPSNIRGFLSLLVKRVLSLPVNIKGCCHSVSRVPLWDEGILFTVPSSQKLLKFVCRYWSTIFPNLKLIKEILIYIETVQSNSWSSLISECLTGSTAFPVFLYIW